MLGHHANVNMLGECAPSAKPAKQTTRPDVPTTHPKKPTRYVKPQKSQQLQHIPTKPTTYVLHTNDTHQQSSGRFVSDPFGRLPGRPSRPLSPSSCRFMR